MELRTMFPNLSAIQTRYTNYETHKIFDGRVFIAPVKDATPITYSYEEQVNDMLLDCLNLGQILYKGDFIAHYENIYTNGHEKTQDYTVMEQACVNVIRKYGCFEEERSFDRASVDPGSDFDSPESRDLLRLPVSQELFSFAVRMLALYVHFCSVKEDIPAQLKNNALRQAYEALASFSKPLGFTYSMTKEHPPRIIFSANSLFAMVQLAYSLCITHPENPIKRCKNCGHLYYNTHFKSEFCSTKCRNYFHVKAFRAREKGE